MNGSDATKLHSRGRPSDAVRRDIVQDLMDAAEVALARKSAKELTLREIAAIAGTDDTMIRYYFGGKDGLLMSLIRDTMKSAPYRKSNEIILDCIQRKTVHPLVSTLASHFYSRPNLIKMMILEISQEDSNIRSLYINEKYSYETVSFIRNAISAMVENGIYREDVNADFAISALIGMICVPAVIPLSIENLETAEKSNDPSWINYISLAIDLTLKPTGQPSC
jgi:AcrR family transcriptional regulator